MTSVPLPTSDHASRCSHRLTRLCGLMLVFLFVVAGTEDPALTSPGELEGSLATPGVPDNATPEGPAHPVAGLGPLIPESSATVAGPRRVHGLSNARARHRLDHARAPPRA